jgi:hypothetical protein
VLVPLTNLCSQNCRRQRVPAFGFGPEANHSPPYGEEGDLAMKTKDPSPKKPPKLVITVRRLEKLETTFGRAPG